MYYRSFLNVYLSHRFIYLHLQQLKASNSVGLEDDREVETLSCTSSSSGDETRDDDCTDGIAFGPYPSKLFYDDENTDLNHRRYGLDRVDSSGACEVRCCVNLMFNNTLSLSHLILTCKPAEFKIYIAQSKQGNIL